MELERLSREELIARIRDLEARLTADGGLEAGEKDRRQAETQQARLRRELEEKNAELQARNAEMASFTSAISHDLKAPLLTISGFLGQIETAAVVGDFDRMRSDLERVGGAADRMREMVDEILLLSKAGQMVSTLDRVSLTQVAREAVRMVGGQLDKAGVEVVIHEPLPNLIGDRARLLQVMQNLVDNAVKFLGEQPHPKIEIGGSEHRGKVGVYVSDNGIGIAPKDQRRVFRLFQRLDKGVDGSGFGLALVKKIVESHRGRVWIESEGRGQGTRVCFSLPTGGNYAEMLQAASATRG